MLIIIIKRYSQHPNNSAAGAAPPRSARLLDHEVGRRRSRRPGAAAVLSAHWLSCRRRSVWMVLAWIVGTDIISRNNQSVQRTGGINHGDDRDCDRCLPCGARLLDVRRACKARNARHQMQGRNFRVWAPIQCLSLRSAVILTPPQARERTLLPVPTTPRPAPVGGPAA